MNVFNNFLINPLREFFSNNNIDSSVVFLNNTLLEYAEALVIFVLLLVSFKIFSSLVLRNLGRLVKKTKTDVDDAVLEVFRGLGASFYIFLSFYLSLHFLALHIFIERILNIIFVVWVFYQVLKRTQILIDLLVEKRIQKNSDTITKTALSLLGGLLKGVLWGLGALMILSNLGVNVSSLIAGLGIGGIAIALALQHSLDDVISSFALYFDKPFQVGDYIVVGEHGGTVEKIGIKTSRLRALQGEEIVIPNKELTSARVQNFRKMEARRVAFTFGVLHQTPVEKVERLPAMVKDSISKIDHIRFDRVHFKTLGNSALIFEVVYYVLSSDYTRYMDIQQAINIELIKILKEEDIVFTYPAQIAQENKPA